MGDDRTFYVPWLDPRQKHDITRLQPLKSGDVLLPLDAEMIKAAGLDQEGTRISVRVENGRIIIERA